MLQMAKAAMSGLLGGSQTSTGQISSLAPLTEIGETNDLVAGSTNKDFIFPTDLGTQDYFVEFKCVQRKKAKRTDSTKETSHGSVFLPLPPNINDAYQANYDKTALGLTGELGKGLGDQIAGLSLSSVKGALDDPKKLQPALTQFAKEVGAVEGVKILKDPAKVAAIVAAISPSKTLGAVTGALAGAASRGALVGEGIATNPFLAQIFTGVNLKSHQFEFKLVPKNQRESELLRSLIMHFKMNMLPSHTLEGELGKTLQSTVGTAKGSAGSRAFFSYPREWRINWAPKVSYDLFPVNQCVLTNFAVSYHGEGKGFYHEPQPGKATPTSVNITLQFEETEIVTRETIEAGDQAAISAAEQNQFASSMNGFM